MRLFRRRNPTTVERAIDLVIAKAAELIDVSRTAAAEIAAGIIGRSLQAADGRPECLSPGDLSRIGRELVMSGESVLVLEVKRGRLLCLPTSNSDVNGPSADPHTWLYTATMAAPSGSETRYVPSAGVLHFTWQTDDATPWAGISPLDTATGDLSAYLDGRMSQEASGPTGRTIPVPKADGSGDELATLKKVNELTGEVLLVETTASGYAGGKSEAPLTDWRSFRLGADFPAAVVQARQDAMSAVVASCGIPPSLVWPSGATDSREAWRRFYHGTLIPLASGISHEMTLKLEEPVSLTFESLGASDIAGRARAAGSLVQAGWSPQEAAEAVLLPEPEPKPEQSESGASVGVSSGAPDSPPVDGPADG